MPARQRRSSSSRTSSRDANVERDVEDEEDAPRRPATLRGARAVAPRCSRSTSGRTTSHDAEHDGEDAADEDGEEIVDPRAAAPQPIEALELEPERHQHAR